MANILVVDDSKFMRKMLADILVKEGHQVVGEAENALEAKDLYHKLKPDLVTLDIIMPRVEGIDASSLLKDIIKTDPQARIVMVSAMGQEEVVGECIQSGAKDFIVKPFQPSQVIKVIKEVLRGV